MRAASGSSVGPSTNAPPSIPSPSEEEDILYYCDVGVSSKIYKKKTYFSYQIPDDLNPHLVALGEWCCSPNLGFGVYEAHLLGGLRLPLNAFAWEILHRPGISINQFNPNAWRLIISMQVLWRKFFDVLLLWTSSYTVINLRR